MNEHGELEAVEKEIKEVLNRHGIDDDMNTPDFILAKYLVRCLAALDREKDETAAWEMDDSTS